MTATYVPGKSLATMADASYQRMLAAGMPAGGIDVYRRTMAEQQALYDAYRAGRGPIAAIPSPSAPHIAGVAMDAHTSTGGRYDPSPAHLWMAHGGDGSSKPKPGEKLRAHEYGWVRSVPSERWHWQYDYARDKVLWRLVQTAIGGLVVDGIPGPKTLAALKSWQKAHGLAVDGIPGPATLAKLTKPAPAPAPKPDPIPVSPAPDAEPVDFRVASYNAQLIRFKGGPYAADATFVKDTLRPSILLAQEVEEAARTAIIAKGVLTKTYPLGSTALLWAGSKYAHGSRIEVSLGTAYHGAIGTELTARNGARFVAASVHIRPNDAIGGTKAQKLAGKLADVAKVIAALAKYPNVIVGGDWSTEGARALLEKAGYKLVTPWVDTYDEAGVQRLDAIYIRGPLLTARTGGTVHSTAASDHHGVVANLTIKPTSPSGL